MAAKETKSNSAAAVDPDYVDCAICLTNKAVSPHRLVNCRHVFCKACLLEKRNATGDVRCPECRTVSFIAVPVTKFGDSTKRDYADLGHCCDYERLERERGLTRDVIVQGMVCTNCLKRDDPLTLIQCEKCQKLWHGLCAVEPVLEPRPEKGGSLPWVCVGCTAKHRVDNGKAERQKRMADAARAKRAESIQESSDADVKKQETKNRRASTKKGRDEAVSFSGHDLGRGAGRNFFKAKRSSSSAVAPHSPDLGGARDDPDFDSEFPDAPDEGDEDY